MIRVCDILARLLSSAALAFFALTMLTLTGVPAYGTIPMGTGCKSCSEHCKTQSNWPWSTKCVPSGGYTGYAGLGKSCVPNGPGPKSRTCKISGGEFQSVNCMCNFWAAPNWTWCTCAKTIKKSK